MAASFQRIKAISSTLLQHRSEPLELSNQLHLLHSVMIEVKEDLPPLRDYLLFPLMLMLDSVHPSRSPSSNREHTQPPVPAASSNRVVESALSCLSLVLEVCKVKGKQISHESQLRHLDNDDDAMDQFMELMQRLMPILSLLSSPPSSAAASKTPPLSDEASALTLGCLSTILLSLPPRSTQMVSEEGPFLPLIGFLISTMIQIGGAAESASVKLASIKTLGSVISALTGSDDQREREGSSALAFFLPGLMGGLSKMLLSLETPPPSSSSSSLSALSSCSIAALACLTEILSACLGDHHAMGLLRAGDSHQSSDEATMTIDETLCKIRDLALNHKSTPSAQNPTPIAPQNKTPQPQPQPQVKGPSSRPSFVVDRTRVWLLDSGSKVSPLLSRLLPPLASHPRSSVRAAVASLAATLLRLPSVVIALGNQGQGER